MSCTDCASNQIKYKGDGSQILFTFPFTYIDQGDVEVYLYDYTNSLWVLTTEWTFENATTIRFNTAPAEPVDEGKEPFNILIARCTSIDPLSATFYPGSSIRAQDLNNNFEQLQFAIEEVRCSSGTGTGGGGGGGFNAIKITESQQKSGQWIKDGVNDNDDSVATTAAISERLDPYFQENTPTSPAYQIPGKLWFDNDNLVVRVWDQVNGTWITSEASGTPGPPGQDGEVLLANLSSQNPIVITKDDIQKTAEFSINLLTLPSV